MPTYVVERFVEAEAIDERELAASARRAAERMTATGTPVAYVGSIVMTDDEMCFCVFEGPSVDAIRETQVLAGLPFERVTLAISLLTSSFGGS